ncbi:UNC-4 protein5 protein [Aphelenchoides avenae]|nr:UNC-4 protein5 protein [Aphelenchus avenae]
MPDIESAEDLKNAGNDAFATGDYKLAIEKYTDALQLAPDNKLKAILHRNRAMVRLNIEDYEGAEDDCDKALEIDGADSKAYYRRALAREQLDKIGPAFKDAKEAARLQPKDPKITKLCEHLLKLNTEKLKEVSSTENKVNEMFKLTFGDGRDEEQKKNAFNNLLVLVRDSEEGALRVWQEGRVVAQMMEVIRNKQQWSDEFALIAIRIIDELVRKRERAVKLIELLGKNLPDRNGCPIVARLTALRPSQEYIDAASVVIQRMFNALAAMDRSKNIKPDPQVADANKVLIVRLILELEEIITDAQYSAPVREATIDIFVKYLMHMDGGLPRGWSWRFTEDRGLLKLLHISSQIPELSDYPVSAETRQHVAICLARLYDDMVFDTRRAVYREKVDMYFNGLMAEISETATRKNTIKLAAFLITMLQGPVDIGLNLVTNNDVLKVMFGMALTDDELQQSLAVELIVHTVSKHERATAVLKDGLPILRQLYKSEDHGVKVRALMGLCKCASAGGDDVSKATMEEEKVLELASKCKAFIMDINKYSVEVRRFACEGLSYLSLDADIKEYIVDDPLLLRALVSLAKSAGALCVYTLASIYVNLSNAYKKPKVENEEELIKLAQFAKHHVPETHPKDTEDFIEKRVRRLVEDGAVSACVAVSKTESKNALDQLARCLLSFSSYEDLCGQIISEGGAKLLLHIYKNGSEDGKIPAAHALAKLGVKSDPNIAFPGQRMYEVVKPMVELLHPDVEGRPNYDALLTLTNLASVSDSVRKRIMKEKAVPKIEEYWFMTDHEDLRAAAAELLLNLLILDEFFEEVVKPGTDRLKLWALYCAEGEDRLRLASSGGFAILTQDKVACRRFIDEIKSWSDLFMEICMSEDPEVQRRCLIGIANMVELDEKVASELIASEVFRVLVAITKLKNEGREGSRKEAQRALDAAEKWGLIKPTDRQLYERQNNLATVPEDG